MAEILPKRRKTLSNQSILQRDHGFSRYNNSGHPLALEPLSRGSWLFGRISIPCLLLLYMLSILDIRCIVAYFCQHLSDNFVDFSDHHVDLSEKNHPSSGLISWFHIVLMPITTIYLSIWYLTSRLNFLTSRHKYLTYTVYRGNGHFQLRRALSDHIFG